MNMLVTPAMLKAARDIGETGLQTDGTVLRRIIVEGEDGADDYEAWATVDTYKCWVRMTNDPVLHDDGRGLVSSIGRYRIHFEHTVSIEEGDEIVVGGETFLVNDVNNEDTYRVFTTATARKAD